jgi:TPR repeat protein
MILSACVGNVYADPVCTFKDPERRRLSHTNADDWACMKLLAADGDGYWQFYVGLQLVNGFNPAGGDYRAYEERRKGNAEGVRLLQSAARSKHSNASANAMNALSKIYLSKDYGVQNYELAYQWSFLASKQSLFKHEYIFDSDLVSKILPERIEELQDNAAGLLQNR